MKVHLVDGTFELFRCYHGAPRHQNRAGVEVGAVRGLLHTLLSLLKDDDTTHVAIAFDALPGPRGPLVSDAELIRSQAPLAFDAVRALGLTLWPMYRYQADDALATGAARLSVLPQVSQIVICTSDTDLFQCIDGQRIVVLNRITKTTSDADTIRSRYGIKPAQFPDFMALSGAPTKGVRGVPGWGPRSTATLLGAYDTLEAIPLTGDFSVSVRNAGKLQAALALHLTEAKLIKSLARLYADLPFPVELPALEWRGVRHEALDSLIETVEAEDLRARLGRWPAYQLRRDD